MKHPPGRRLPGASLLLALPALLLQWMPRLACHLEFDRRAVAAGQVWRLVTGHWTHGSLGHLLWDLAAFAGLAAACELEPGCGRKRMLGTVGLAAAVIPAVLWLALPGMATYRGLSGIDSGLFVLLVVTYLRQDLVEGRRGWAGLEVLALALFLAKCGYEAATGQAFFIAAGGFVPVPLAHIIGGLCPLPLLYAWRADARRQHPLRALARRGPGPGRRPPRARQHTREAGWKADRVESLRREEVRKKADELRREARLLRERTRQLVE